MTLVNSENAEIVCTQPRRASKRPPLFDTSSDTRTLDARVFTDLSRRWERIVLGERA